MRAARGQQRELVERQRPAQAGARDEGNAAHIAALDVLDDPAEQLVHAAVVDHDAVCEGGARPRPDRDDQRVVVQLGAALGVCDAPLGVDMREAVGDHLGAGLRGDPRDRVAARRRQRERLADGHRAVDELGVRRHDRDRDEFAGEVRERQRRLEPGDAAARDHDPEALLTGHRAQTMPDRTRGHPRRAATSGGATLVHVTDDGGAETSRGGDGAIRIVLADDHAVVRSGLRMLLDAEEDFEVVAEAGDVDAARRYVRGHHATVLVLDLNMPGGPSLDAIPALRAECPDTQIVVLTMQDAPAYARQALSAGALGYVLKEAADTELVDAVRRAAAGETYLNPALGARIAREPPPGPPDDLSEREVEVLRLIALGHTNTEIAAQLYLSVRTVETHRSHIQQKLRLSSRADLVRYALQRGLIADG